MGPEPSLTHVCATKAGHPDSPTPRGLWQAFGLHGEAAALEPGAGSWRAMEGLCRWRAGWDCAGISFSD